MIFFISLHAELSGDLVKVQKNAHSIEDLGVWRGAYLRRLLGVKKEWMPENTPEQKRKPL